MYTKVLHLSALFFAISLAITFQTYALEQLHYNECSWVSFKKGNKNVAPDIATKVSQYGYDISISVAGFQRQQIVHNGKTFDEVSLPGWTQQNEVGKPGLPMKPVFIELPDGIDYQITATVVEQKQLLSGVIYPTQPFVTQDQPIPPLHQDRGYYNSNQTFPSQYAVKSFEQRLRNHRILELQLVPFRYNNKSKTLFATVELIIHVRLASSVLPGSQPQFRHAALASPAYDQVMIQGIPSIFNYTPDQVKQNTPEKYMILMNDQFASNKKLQEFIDWKTYKGSKVVLVKTSDISSSGPSASQIVQYMRGLSDEDYPTYLLIIGMDDKSGGVQPVMYSGSTPTDLDFACRTSSDFIPDLFYARLPASNNNELDILLERITEMDRNPPQSDMYQKVLMAGQIQDNEGQKNHCDRMHCETSDAIACYFEQDAGGVDYNCVRAITNPHGANANCLWRNDGKSILWQGVSGEARKISNRVYQHFIDNTEARKRINESVNKGVALVQHRDHGNVTGWGNPSYRTSNLSALKNGKNRPLVLSNNCLSGSYHKSNSFAKGWMLHKNGGSYAYMGCTMTSSWGWLDYICHGKFMAFLPDWRSWHNTSENPDWTNNLPKPDFGGEGVSTRLGQVLNFGKLYMYQKYGSSSYCQRHYKIFHLFGDPEGYVQFLKPVTLEVKHPQVVDIGPANIKVTCGRKNINVCLYNQENNIHQILTTDANGSADFSVGPTQKGTIRVTVSGYGVRPYEGKVEIGGTGIDNELRPDWRIKIQQISLKKNAHGHVLYLPISELCQVSLINLQGKRVCSFPTQAGKSLYQIPSELLSAGIFILNISDRLNNTIKKSILVY